MKTENQIIEVEGGYKLANGNAQSVDNYASYDAAKEAAKADVEARENAEDAAEAEENSPVEWE